LNAVSATKDRVAKRQDATRIYNAMIISAPEGKTYLRNIGMKSYCADLAEQYHCLRLITREYCGRKIWSLLDTVDNSTTFCSCELYSPLGTLVYVSCRQEPALHCCRNYSSTTAAESN